MTDYIKQIIKILKQLNAKLTRIITVNVFNKHGILYSITRILLKHKKIQKEQKKRHIYIVSLT